MGRGRGGKSGAPPSSLKSTPIFRSCYEMDHVLFLAKFSPTSAGPRETELGRTQVSTLPLKVNVEGIHFECCQSTAARFVNLNYSVSRATTSSFNEDFPNASQE